jgi:hypothetical protein
LGAPVKSTRRVLAVLAMAGATALAAFVGVNLAALSTHGFARADLGDVVWTVAGTVAAITLLRWGISAWRRERWHAD